MRSARPRSRSGVTDQLGLRGMEALMEQNGTGVPTTGTNMSNMLVRHRRRLFRSSMIKVVNNRSFLLRIQHPLPPPQQQQQNNPSQQSQNPYPQYQYHRGYDPRVDPRYTNSRYYMMDELHNYPDDASVYFQSHIQSLVASPATKLHMINSRSIRRTVLSRSPAMHQLKAAFPTPVADACGARFPRRALDTALNALDVLKSMYEHRVARWNSERMHKTSSLPSTSSMEIGLRW
ncbi:hypothetical protein M378DRAFT_16941 [Amanita muscaria Koide BX008]|uniref:Uncharacterized protein n=1 Tax=Amanita muscaria (strain Koide BX008) TaxID=946122 RepID=A0A0C2WKD0_AMAMK|nr:hypothetical protein M378DRAFT_16941 [Amanita muscaria Koide BX008]